MWAQRIRAHLPSITRDSPSDAYQTLVFFACALFFLAGMHTLQNHLGGEGLQIPSNNIGWIIISLIISCALWLVSKTRQIHYTPLTTLLLISSLLITLPIFYPDANLRGITFLLGLWGGYSAYIALLQFNFTVNQKNAFLGLVICAVFIESILALCQFYWFGESNSFGYDAKLNRPYGTFYQPNVMASFMATGTAISAYLLLFTTQKTVRAFLYLNIVITAFVITVLLSRTGWLSLACITPLILMGLWRYDKKVTFYVTLCIIFVVLWGCAENFLWRDITSLMPERVTMESSRAYTYPQTLALWLEKPWFGWGYGLFEPAYLQFSAKGYANGIFEHAGLVGMAHAHNEILQLGAQGGIIPVIGFLLAVTAITWFCLQQPTRWLIIASFTPLALHTQLEYPFYHSIPHWFTFILLVFVFDNGKLKALSAPSAPTLRLSAILISALCSVFMLTTMHTTYNLYRYETGNRKDLSLVVNNLNPIAWYRHLNFYLTVQSINAAVAAKDKEKLKLIEPWIKEDMRYYPRPEYYNMLSTIYHQLGRNEELAQLSQEAIYLLPHNIKLFASNYFKINLPQLYALHKKISREIEQSNMDSTTNKRHITEK